MDPDTIIALVEGRKWFAVSSALVRYSKGDLPMPTWMQVQFERIPAKARPAIAIGLGVASGALDSLANGRPWKSAIVYGIASGAVAIFGHGVFIEGARGGRELGTPK